jgi:DNA-binding HxlR family transcriptional regulator
LRVGGKALSLLSVPLNVHILRALEEGPLTATELRRAAGSPPQTTLRLYVRGLVDIGALERRRGSGFSATVEHELAPPGRDLLAVAEVLQRWLGACPEGPIALGSTAAKSAIKALVEAWSANIVRALAARPLSLTELSRLIPSVNYPALERKLAAMRHAGLAAVCPGGGRGTPYGPSRWLRCSTAPLAAAVAWERHHLGNRAAPIGKVDVESALLLAVPQLRLPEECSGRCRLVVEVRPQGSLELAGVVAELEEGRVTRCASRLEGWADAWISGTSQAWLERLLQDQGSALEVGGDGELAEAILLGLQRTQVKVA